jgi:hypothetical protein
MHEGGVLANDVLEYTLGTIAEPVGHLPVPGRPGEVSVLWRATETLHASFLHGGSPTTGGDQEFLVRPEAGDPDRFAWNDTHPPPSFFLLVNAASEETPALREELVFLADQYGNRTAANVPVEARSESTTLQARLVAPEPGLARAPGLYGLVLTWERGRLPSGETTVDLSAAWNGRTIVHRITLSFDVPKRRVVEPPPPRATEPAGLSFRDGDMGEPEIGVLKPVRRYLRLVEPAVQEDEVQAVVWNATEEGEIAVPEQRVTLRRVGRSSLFLAPVVFKVDGGIPEIPDDAPGIAVPFLERSTTFAELRSRGAPDRETDAIADAAACFDALSRALRLAKALREGRDAALGGDQRLEGGAAAPRIVVTGCGPTMAGDDAVLEGGRWLGSCLPAALRTARIYPGSDALAEEEAREDRARRRQTNQMLYKLGYPDGEARKAKTCGADRDAHDRLHNLPRRDAWGTPFRISPAGAGCRIVSAGADRTFGDNSVVAPGYTHDPAEDLVQVDGRLVTRFVDPPPRPHAMDLAPFVRAYRAAEAAFDR